jgi:hypothetical protein
VAKTAQDPEYDLLVILDLLMDLREDMETLGISTLEELDERIREIESRLRDDDGFV